MATWRLFPATPAEELEFAVSSLCRGGTALLNQKTIVKRSSDTKMSRRLFVQGSGTKKAIDHLRMFRCSYIPASLSLPEVAPPRHVSPPRFVPLQGRVAIALLPRLSDCIHHCQQRAARDCKCHKGHPNHQDNPRSQWQVRKRPHTLH